MADKGYGLSVIIGAVDRLTAPLRGMLGKVQGFTAGVGRAIDRTGLPIFTNSLKNVGHAVGGVGSAVGASSAKLLGLGATLGITGAALGMFVEGYADATGAIGDTAERTGISRERFQELGFAAKLTGSSSEVLAGALQKMNINVGAATKGSKELKEMFAGLGINIRDSGGKLKSTDAQFDMFVDRISKIKDPSLQAQAAVKIFGKSATELLPLIRGGSAGLKDMSSEARRLGIVLSDDAVRDGEAFGDILDTLKAAVGGVGNIIGTALVPELSKMSTWLTESIVKYRPQIEAFATAFAKDLPGNIERIVGFLGDLYDGIQPVISAVGWLVGAAPANGYVGIYAIYNPATGASALLAVNATSAAVPETYGGVNMPAGYSASALVSVWPTNASSLLVVGILIDRAVSFVGKNAVTTSTGPVTFTGLFINGIVPQNAKTIVGNLNGSSTSVGSVMQVFVAADVNGSGAVAAGFTVGVAGQGTSSFFEIDIGSIQQMFWKASSTLGTPTYNISISSYKF